jgi:hypothetical protein
MYGMPSGGTGTEPITLIGHVTGDNTDSGKWHKNMSPNHYAIVIILGSVVSLWLLGGAFRSVRS